MDGCVQFLYQNSKRYGAIIPYLKMGGVMLLS